ncbi:unnamed protein product [Rotaria sordida]|uniref:Uncharacterized protein n=1 Tax=Rotaria sordida TaxID=392033 RepID=A0A815QGV7_9BILA|nr:unnamed protein product [Rotaria sordida]
MLSKFDQSLFSKSWVDGPEGILIQGGLALIAIGTTGYILNKVFNRSPAAIPTEESITTDDMLKNRAYSAAVKEHLRATYAHFAGGLTHLVFLLYNLTVTKSDARTMGNLSRVLSTTRTHRKKSLKFGL